MGGMQNDDRIFVGLHQVTNRLPVKFLRRKCPLAPFSDNQPVCGKPLDGAFCIHLVGMKLKCKLPLKRNLRTAWINPIGKPPQQGSIDRILFRIHPAKI